MARLFPLKSETPDREGAPRIVDLADEDADAVFSALSSTTARQIYTRLGEEPGTPSDIAESIDSSIQNVRYHLENLEDAGLVEVVDTWYSSRGNEMSVYATTDGPLIVTNDQSRAAQLKEAISRFVGGVTILAAASLFVQFAVERFFSPAAESGQFAGSGGGDGGDAGDAGGADGGGGDAGDGDAGDMDAFSRDGDEDAADMEEEEDAAAEGDAGGDGSDGSDGGDGDGGDDGVEIAQEDEADAPETEAVEEDATSTESLDTTDANETVTGTETPDGATETPETVTTATDGAAEATDAFVSTVPPGLLFFLGGVLVLSVVTAWWYWSYR